LPFSRRLTSTITGDDAPSARAWWLLVALGAVASFVLLAIAGADLLTRLSGALVVALLISDVCSRRMRSSRRLMSQVRTLDGNDQSKSFDTLKWIPTIAIGLWAGWVVANVLFNPLFSSVHYGAFVLLFALVGIVLVMPIVYKYCGVAARWYSERHGLTKGLLFAATLAILGVVQAYFASRVLRPSGFDSAVVLDAAMKLADGSHDSYAMTSSYFANYPTNVLLLIIEWGLFSLLHFFGIYATTSLLWGAVLLNVVSLLLGFTFTVLAAARIAGGGTALFVGLLCIPFIIFSPWISVPYTDIYGLPFPPILLFIFLVSHNARRLRSRITGWVAIGLITAVGYNVKPTIVFMTIAILVVFIVGRMLRGRDSGTPAPATSIGARFLATGGIAALVAVPFLAGSAAVVALENNSGALTFSLYGNQLALPPSHFLMMGAGGDGGYSQADVIRSQSLPTRAEKVRDGFEGYFARVSAMGPTGYAQFLGKKALTTAADGTMGQWSEGGLLDHPFVLSDAVSKAVQSYYGPTGANRQSLVIFWQALWLFVLIAVALPLVGRSKQQLSDGVTIARLTIVLLVVYLLFFETRSRYLYLFLPIILLAGGVSFGSFIEHPSKLFSRWTKFYQEPRATE
jgi:hypothetical protein